MKLVAIIQARMGSSRLPGKILKPILNKPMLLHIVERLRRVARINEVIIATSESAKDDAVCKMANDYNITWYRGSESDVLSRFYNTAQHANADHIIRITGDCPMVDPPTITKLISLYFSERIDYCGIACGAGVLTETNINRYPDGLDAEIFSFQVLEAAHNEASSDLYREHVTPFIWKQQSRFSCSTLYAKNDYSAYRWTVDNQRDFEFVNWIYCMLYPTNKNFHMGDILALLEHYPNAAKNKHLIGQEGYEKFWLQE